MKKFMQICEVIGFLFLSLAIATGSSDVWLIPLILGVGGVVLMGYAGYVISWLEWNEEQEKLKDGRRKERNNKRAV